MAKKYSERRLAENEVVFREANEAVQTGLQDLQQKARAEGFADLYHNDPEDETALQFYCECADEKCRERIIMTPSKYKGLHPHSTTFVVLPGHEVPEVERVLIKEADYSVVEKFMTPPAKAVKMHRTGLQNTKKPKP